LQLGSKWCCLDPKAWPISINEPHFGSRILARVRRKWSLKLEADGIRNFKPAVSG
jgi:hypothetical protein